jgi:hypothetical protein
MTFLRVVTGAALAVAVAALIATRRAAKRLAQLSEMYWELKYQHLELRKQMERVGGAEPPAAPAASAATPPAANSSGPPSQSFVPLTSLRR